MTKQDFFEAVYASGHGAENAALYDEWADSYDDALDDAGYATPARVAQALAAAGADRTAPVLDFGCGTGLSGEALKAEGFAAIDGWDVSEGMLEVATRKGVYRALTRIDPEATDFAPVSDYPAVVAAGVIGAGAAPLSVFDGIMEALPSGGVLAFSYNDHTLADPGYEARVMEWLDCGGAELVSREHGDHLPARGIGAVVYVLRKR